MQTDDCTILLQRGPPLGLGLIIAQGFHPIKVILVDITCDIFTIIVFKSVNGNISSTKTFGYS